MFEDLVKDLRDEKCGDGTYTKILMRREAAEAIELLERGIELSKAAYDLLKKQEKSSFVLNLLEESVFYDEVWCDGYCLMEDVECFMEELEWAKKSKKS